MGIYKSTHWASFLVLATFGWIIELTVEYEYDLSNEYVIKTCRHGYITEVQYACECINAFVMTGLLPAIRSLERRARYLFYCMFVCLFVRSTISQQPASRFTPYFACRRSLGRDVSSPLLGGWRPPAGGKRGKWNFRYYGSQWGIFAFWRILSDISATRARIHTKYYLYTDNVCRRAPSPCGIHRPLGAGGGGVKNSKHWGWSHSCCGQLPFLFFSAMPNVVQYVGHRPAHILA